TLEFSPRIVSKEGGIPESLRNKMSFAQIIPKGGAHMRSRLGLVLFVFGLAIVASGCLSLQGADKTTAEVEAIAKKLGELIGENDAEGIADLLVFPATLMYYDDAYTFTSRQEFIALTDFSYPDGTLHKHEVSVPHILAHENYASTIVRMVSDW